MTLHFNSPVSSIASLSVSLWCALCFAVLPAQKAIAHDLWIEPSSSLVRTGEPVQLDFKLGNCDNGHPDFMTNSMLPRPMIQAVAHLPSNVSVDLDDTLTPTANPIANGFWSRKWTSTESGVHWMMQRLDQVVEHGQTVQGILFAKTPVVFSEQLDKVLIETKPVGFSQPFEIILHSSPLPDLESGNAILVQVLKDGVELPGVRVSFAPFGVQLKGQHDPEHQVDTDRRGFASYTPRETGRLLISCHWLDDSASSQLVDATYYSSTMLLCVSAKSSARPETISSIKSTAEQVWVAAVNQQDTQTPISWPVFLGTQSTGVQSHRIPTHWSASENVAWKTPLLGHGQSSPVVWGDSIFVTTVDGPMKDTYHVLCLDRTTGKQRWDHAVKNASPVTNSYFVSRAAPTPIVDSHQVIAFFESGDCVALSHEGHRYWHRQLDKDFGPFNAEFGLGASPCQDAERVYLLLEHEGPGNLVALAKSTGEIVWNQPRPAGRSWSSPAYFEIDGVPQIVVSSNGSAEGLSAVDGSMLWSVGGLGGNTGVTPIDAGNGTLLMGASPGRNGENEASAKKSNGLIQVKRSQQSWTADVSWVSDKLSPTWASPIQYAGYAYWINRVGVVTCVEASTGKIVYNQRLKQACWATPIAIDDRIFFFGKDGLTTVISAGPEFRVLAENELIDPSDLPVETTPMAEEATEERRRSASTFSGPTLYGAAVAGDILLLRIGNQLYGIRQ